MGIALASALASAAITARADPTKDQCVDADTRAQSLRRDGKLSAAREQLKVCVSQACPQLVRDDCAQRLDEVERAQPTIVFEVHDAAGKDLSAVRVLLDGHAWLERVDGSPVAIDPGAHTFTFQAMGQPPITQPFIIREGDKARRERVVIGTAYGPPPAPAPAPAPAAPPPPPAATTQAPPPPTAPAPGPQGSVPASAAPPGPAEIPPPPPPAQGAGPRPLRTAGYVVGGVGLGVLILGAAFGLSAMSSWDQAKGLCNVSSCPSATRSQAESDRSNAVTASTLSTASLVIGGVLVAGGVVLFVVAPARGPAKTGAWIAPVVGPGSAGLELRGAF
jgi:hypothetical protein